MNKGTLYSLLLGLMVITSCQQKDKKSISAIDSVYDLQKWNFQIDGIASLEGDWDFYWDQSITRIEELPDTFKIKSGRVHVPGFWSFKNSQFLADEPYGMLTLHATIILPDNANQYSLKFKSVVSAYEVWANGKLISQTGKVSSNKEDSKPDFQPQIIALPKADRVELFLVISNFHHRKGGGSWEPIFIGREDQIRKAWKNSYSFDLFSASMMFFIAVYHLLMFAFYPREKSYLYFALAVFAVFLRTMTTGEMVVEQIIPRFPYVLNQQLRYVGYVLPLGLLPLFIHYFLENESIKLAFGCFLGSLITNIVIFAIPVHWSTHLTPLFHGLAFINTSCCIYLIMQAQKRFPTESKLLMGVAALMFIVLLHAILRSFDFIKGEYYHEEGFLILILMQVIIMAYRHKKIHTEKNKLQLDLKHKDGDLAMVISDNQMRHQFRRDVLENIEEVNKSDTEGLRSRLNSFITDLKLQLETEEKLNYFQENIDNINAEFAAKMKGHYPNLTQAELEICYLTKLNLSIKEISRIQKTSEGAIKVARHRIKKKLNLSNVDQLKSVIQNLN